MDRGHVARVQCAPVRVKGASYKALDREVTVAGVPCQALPDGATVKTGDSDFEPAIDYRRSPLTWDDVHGYRRQVG